MSYISHETIQLHINFFNSLKKKIRQHGIMLRGIVNKITIFILMIIESYILYSLEN
jgi:hypothetical protein